MVGVDTVLLEGTILEVWVQPGDEPVYQAIAADAEAPWIRCDAIP